jgi:hypothetical protein
MSLTRHLASAVVATTVGAGLVLAGTGTALADIVTTPEGTMEAVFSETSVYPGQTVNLHFNVTPNSAAESASVGPGEFGVVVDNRLEFVSNNNVPARCTASPQSISQTTRVTCSEEYAGRGLTKFDTFTFRVRSGAVPGTIEATAWVDYSSVSNEVELSLEINAGSPPPQCSSSTLNIRGYCLPNPLSETVRDVTIIRALVNPATPRDVRIAYAEELRNRIVEFELSRRVSNVVWAVIQSGLANQGRVR